MDQALDGFSRKICGQEARGSRGLPTDSPMS
jgi:hypothetical protein